MVFAYSYSCHYYNLLNPLIFYIKLPVENIFSGRCGISGMAKKLSKNKYYVNKDRSIVFLSGA